MIANAATKKVPAKTVRCAIYTRKSTEDGLEQEFNSLDAQRESGESYVASQKSMGWVALDERYDDGGYTGGNMDRPALERLLADIAAGKVDCVVVYKVDRLSRSLMDFARMMQVFDKHSVSFVSVTQHFDTSTSMGRLILNVLLSFAQFEREIISERIRDKKAATAKKGKWCGGVPVLGYDIDRSNGSPRLVVNAAEAARVREIFALYLKLGSLLPVVEELAQRGWRNKRWTSKGGKVLGGLPFNKTNLYCMLVNPVYSGKIVHKTDLYDGEHEAIIPRDTFQRVQAQLQHNGRGGGPEARNKHGALLRGLLFCKACGSAMTHSFVAKKDKRYRYYTCTQAIKFGRKICPSGSLPAAEIERVVVEQVRCVGQDEDVFQDVLRQAQTQADAELAALRAEQADLENELARHHREIRRLAVKGPASSATTAQIADLHDKVAQAERRATELRDKLDVVESQRVGESEVRAALGDFEGLWQTLTPKEQAKMLSTLIARVDYDVAESTVSVAFHPSPRPPGYEHAQQPPCFGALAGSREVVVSHVTHYGTRGHVSRRKPRGFRRIVKIRLRFIAFIAFIAGNYARRGPRTRAYSARKSRYSRPVRRRNAVDGVRYPPGGGRLRRGTPPAAVPACGASSWPGEPVPWRR